eukprot:TRINITY_DN3931_c0_g1_i2.p1 TRINITY_DN3931_c0_g1~~TRINITY_DN3931_c0_g1_i2.p1  ORF type:complete len:409 (+),score=271.04 TRINITY_DN3931_c0_g1_i2:77-1228(+)
MADDEKPGMDEDLDEEVRHEAAVIIQKHWRESNMRQLAMDQLDDDEPVITEHERKLQLIEDFKEELDMRDKMLEENMRMQRALSRHFDQKKQADQDKGGEAQSQAELENKYVLLLEELRRGRLELEALKEQNQEDLDIAKEKMNNYQQKATEYELSFRRHKREIAEKAGFSRNKKPIPKKRLDLNDQMEEQGSQEVKLARIGYIKMRNRAKKLSEQLKEKEKLTDGLHLIDFEQLKIENTTLNEKIEERNEEVLKLKKKATTTIHILTHVKEKLQYIQGENMTLKKTLEQLDTTLDENRAKMTEVKKDRDVFASENVKMREKMPMIGSEDLLMDYELRKQQIETLRIEVVEKTNHHHELMLWIDKWQPTVHQRQAQVQTMGRV